MDLVLQRGQPAPTASACPFTERSRFPEPAPSLKVRVASALAKEGVALPLPTELVDDDVTITGKKHKMQILQEYEAEFGANYPNSMITKKKGKHSHEPDMVRPTPMFPSIKKYYQVQ